jgi:hypothetical protein
MSKKTKWQIGLGLLVLCYALLCWPGVLLFNKTSPIILGLPPFAFVNYLMVLIIVGIMLLLYKEGVGE